MSLPALFRALELWFLLPLSTARDLVSCPSLGLKPTPQRPFSRSSSPSTTALGWHSLLLSALQRYFFSSFELDYILKIIFLLYSIQHFHEFGGSVTVWFLPSTIPGIKERKICQDLNWWHQVSEDRSFSMFFLKSNFFITKKQGKNEKKGTKEKNTLQTEAASDFLPKLWCKVEYEIICECRLGKFL